MSRVRLRQRQLLVALGLAVLGLAFAPGAAGAATLGKTTVGASNSDSQTGFVPR